MTLAAERGINKDVLQLLWVFFFNAIEALSILALESCFAHKHQPVNGLGLFNSTWILIFLPARREQGHKCCVCKHLAAWACWSMHCIRDILSKWASQEGSGYDGLNSLLGLQCKSLYSNNGLAAYIRRW